MMIERIQLIEQERARIASDMHDDLGSGLTNIRYLSDRAIESDDPLEDKIYLKRIGDYSSQLVRNMSELIWAMNSNLDSLANLCAYVRRYAYEYLDPFKLKLVFECPDFQNEVHLSTIKRRNLFLVVKEFLHNVVKHAHASEVMMKIECIDHSFRLTLSDNGRGFNEVQASGSGNGLNNIRKRLEQIGAQCNLSSSDQGTQLSILLLLVEDQDSGA